MFRSSKKSNLRFSDSVYISELIILDRIILDNSRLSIYIKSNSNKPVPRYPLRILFIIIIFLRIRINIYIYSAREIRYKLKKKSVSRI